MNEQTHRIAILMETQRRKNQRYRAWAIFMDHRRSCDIVLLRSIRTGELFRDLSRELSIYFTRIPIRAINWTFMISTMVSNRDTSQMTMLVLLWNWYALLSYRRSGREQLGFRNISDLELRYQKRREEFESSRSIFTDLCRLYLIPCNCNSSLSILLYLTIMYPSLLLIIFLLIFIYRRIFMYV